MREIFIVAAVLAAGGCQTHDNIITGPSLSPVGEGLAVARDPLPVSFAEPRLAEFQSLWTGTEQDLFKDRKARRVGDVVTVNISIDDKAQFDNESDRSRTSATTLGFGADLGWAGFDWVPQAGKASGNLGIHSGTTSSGEGSVERSERLRLSIAAVVTEELPNGNLLISGSQEVMVNNEVRVLNIAGIARPSDISMENSIAYDKIAEARITYGGRGRLTDVQQPAWGQRIYDKIVPF
jgi:flagellar L-ring protein precursor FlgH